MTKRIRATLNGEEYILVKGKWLDSHYLEMPLNVALQLTEQVLGDNIDDFSNEELEQFIMGFKDQGLTTQALRVANVLYARYERAADMHKLRWLMPVETSLLRLSHTPQKAVDFYNSQIAKFGNEISSPQVLTSVAAAYCDLGDYAKAKQICDRAFSWGGWSYELSAVYERIKRETE